MKVAIWGAGAVGIGLANALAEPNAPLCLIGRDETTLRAIEASGIERRGVLGHRSVSPDALRVESNPGKLAEDPPDWLLVCTKAFASTAVARVLGPIAPALLDRTRIVLCQNGWGNEIPFLSVWPKAKLFHARVITGFHRHGDHEVEITAHAAPIAIGSLYGLPPTGLQDLANRLAEGGIPTEVRDDMESVLWAKMLYNCALNPLGALTHRRYGELAKAPVTREIMACVVAEIFSVLDRTGYEIEWTNADAYLEAFYRDLIPPTANHQSSMLQDLRAGKPTEIEALCGAVERLGAQWDVATPVISALAALVRAAEQCAPRA